MEITVETHIHASLETVWEAWTTPSIVQQWNTSLDWLCPVAEIDLHEGGEFFYRLEKADGSKALDFRGVFKRLKLLRLIEYRFLDGRRVTIDFLEKDSGTTIIETFEASIQEPEEEQKLMWQQILDYFKRIVETNRLLS